MTAQQTRPNVAAMMEALMMRLRGFLSFATKLVLGFAILVAAGMLALVTAVAGLVLAGLAILMRIFARPGQMRRWDEDARRSNADGTVTLDARRTPRGWTVE